MSSQLKNTPARTLVAPFSTADPSWRRIAIGRAKDLGDKRICGAKKRRREDDKYDHGWDPVHDEGAAVSYQRSPSGTYRPCECSPMKNGRCYTHGGNTPRGIAHPNFKTGEHMRHRDALPGDLTEAFDRVLNSDATDLVDLIGILHARLHSLLEIVRDEEGTRDQWATVKGALAAYENAEEPDGDALASAVRSAVNGYQDHEHHFRQIENLTEKIAGAVESQLKKQKISEQMVEVTAVIGLIHALRKACATYIDDREVLQKIEERTVDITVNELPEAVSR